MERAKGFLVEESLSSHDVSSSVRVRFLPIPSVCWNSLMMPAKFGTQLRIRHDAKLRAQMALAAKNLDLIETSYAAIGAEFAEFARITMNEEPLGDYLRTVFPEPADKEDRRAMRFVAKCRTRARYLFEEGAGNQMDKDPWDTLGRLQRHNRIRRS